MFGVSKLVKIGMIVIVITGTNDGFFLVVHSHCATPRQRPAQIPIKWVADPMKICVGIPPCTVRTPPHKFCTSHFLFVSVSHLVLGSVTTPSGIIFDRIQRKTQSELAFFRSTISCVYQSFMV